MMVKQASDFLARLRQTWRRVANKRRAINELAACPPSELRRIASDVGLNGDDLMRLCCSHTGPSELLPRRLQLLGIDPEFMRHAAPTTFRDLARVCASCKASRHCARDLARGDVQAGMDGYCLNALSIDALTVRDGRTIQ
jgi:uncharacterized protein YjiS (DUF1127 family)